VNRSSRSDFRDSRRRGVTLVEMLVTVAVLVIIMTILVQVFQSATGALSAAQTIQELDDRLKLLDSTIRSDLGGVTARFTPPLDPALNLGYFEYGENEFPDIQGEDSDDYIRFTAKAPPDRPFTGRMWVNPLVSTFYNANPQPITITSEYAEIIYFLRNGNLYRRVLLVAPGLQSGGSSSIVPAIGNVPYPTDGVNLVSKTNNTFSPSLMGGTALSWQGVNDLSARPAATGPSNSPSTPTALAQAAQTIVLNTLGDLTNRENRFAYSRFANDFWNASAGAAGTDGIPDDVDGDNVPDYYPSLYYGVFPSTAGGLSNGPIDQNGNAIQLIYEPNYGSVTRSYLALMGFPFVYPGAYSVAQTLSSDAYGWIHSPNPLVYLNATTSYQYDTNAFLYLQNLNHNPLDLGDNLPIPPNNTTGYVQTWWGFPTWRETLSAQWTDPTVQVNIGPNILATTGAVPAQPVGLAPLDPTAEVAKGTVVSTRALLPAMTTLWRNPAQLYNDGYGDPSSNGANTFFTNTAGTVNLWNSLSWEDDLIMTGVRSFDVKAYDNALAGYADLGWGDDLRLYTPFSTTSGYVNNGLQYLNQTPPFIAWPPLSTSPVYSTINQTFAHEGRMPPMVEDNRLDYQNPNSTYTTYLNTFTPQYTGFANYSSNIGDDNTGIVRLRRVWDSWSTEYSKAPANAVNVTGFPAGPPFSPPVYPSYPPPYPAPLRGIQIQIRVADPANQRVKSITIRQDFTDKL
jgi:prepilin-type N-terminal cleavage/methylation domain-containing protein